MVVEPGAADDEFVTSVKLRSTKDNSTLTRSGKSLVYAGYSWRGTSKGSGPAGSSARRFLATKCAKHCGSRPINRWPKAAGIGASIRSSGFDVKLHRASAEPTLTAVDRASLKTGTQADRVRLLGDNLPAQPAPADLDFGTGVTVRRIVSHTGSEIVAEVDVAANAVSGKRDVALRRSVLQNAIAVYDRVDYIKVTPDTALAHLGSDVHPQGFQQFEAIGYQRGADG